jgi:outer membrane protein OmpA-like peptidoglycan-associated protein
MLLHPATDLTKLRIGPVYFDFDKSNIRSDAARELDSIANMLQAHPDWDILLSGNADCRGSSEYNMALSQRRAESAKLYLSNKGISTNRMRTQAFGESKLVNHCSDGVSCSEAEHQLNRRVESKLSQRNTSVGLR